MYLVYYWLCSILIMLLTGVRSPSQHPARVIWCFCRSEFYLSVYWICSCYNWHRGVIVLQGEKKNYS